MSSYPKEGRVTRRRCTSVGTSVMQVRKTTPVKALPLLVSQRVASKDYGKFIDAGTTPVSAGKFSPARLAWLRQRRGSFTDQEHRGHVDALDT